LEAAAGGIEDGIQERRNDGIITTSAMPFGASFESRGGSTSISSPCNGKSDPRAMT